MKEADVIDGKLKSKNRKDVKEGNKNGRQTSQERSVVKLTHPPKYKSEEKRAGVK